MARPKNDGKGRLGGRVKGTPNKVSKERRELIDTFLNDNWKEFQDMYKRAPDETKMKIYMELIPYTTPKMASVEYKEKIQVKTFKDELDELSGEQTR